MTKEALHTDAAPAAIGTYSQAIRAGSFVFLSGQIPLDPATMTIVEGDFEARAALGVAALPKGADVEAEAILAL